MRLKEVRKRLGKSKRPKNFKSIEEFEDCLKAIISNYLKLGYVRKEVYDEYYKLVIALVSETKKLIREKNKREEERQKYRYK